MNNQQNLLRASLSLTVSVQWEKLSVGFRRQLCPSHVPQQLTDVTLLATSRAATVEVARVCSPSCWGEEQLFGLQEAVILAFFANVNITFPPHTTASSH